MGPMDPAVFVACTIGVPHGRKVTRKGYPLKMNFCDPAHSADERVSKEIGLVDKCKALKQNINLN